MIKELILLQLKCIEQEDFTERDHIKIELYVDGRIQPTKIIEKSAGTGSTIDLNERITFKNKVLIRVWELDWDPDDFLGQFVAQDLTQGDQTHRIVEDGAEYEISYRVVIETGIPIVWEKGIDSILPDYSNYFLAYDRGTREISQQRIVGDGLGIQKVYSVFFDEYTLFDLYSYWVTRVVAYDSVTGRLRFLKKRKELDFRSGYERAWTKRDWLKGQSHIVWLNAPGREQFLSYSAVDGKLFIHSFDKAVCTGNPKDLRVDWQAEWETGWTDIIPLINNYLLFYNKITGAIRLALYTFPVRRMIVVLTTRSLRQSNNRNWVFVKRGGLPVRKQVYGGEEEGTDRLGYRVEVYDPIDKVRFTINLKDNQLAIVDEIECKWGYPSHIVALYKGYFVYQSNNGTLRLFKYT